LSRDQGIWARQAIQGAHSPHPAVALALRNAKLQGDGRERVARQDSIHRRVRGSRDRSGPCSESQTQEERQELEEWGEGFEMVEAGGRGGAILVHVYTSSRRPDVNRLSAEPGNPFVLREIEGRTLGGRN